MSVHLYNAACYCQLKYRDKAIEALRRREGIWRHLGATGSGLSFVTGSRSLKGFSEKPNRANPPAVCEHEFQRLLPPASCWQSIYRGPD